MSSVTIAAVQAASVLLDQEATLGKAVELIAKAAAAGARIVVFPEVFIPSTIVDPNGTILAGPARHEEAILTAQIELSAVHAARRYFDLVGHYHRPDIFQLNVDTRPRPAVRTG